MAAIDPDSLPNDVDLLQKIVVELCERLQHESSEKNKYRSLLRELLEAQRNRKSEQLSKEQLALFETLWKASDPEAEKEEGSEPEADPEADKPEEPQQVKKRVGGNRWPRASFVNGSCTTCPKQRSIAAAAARICACSMKKSASATSMFRRRSR